ncbi:MAG: Holliday junction resolvase RuvX [Nakamurella sp.]
MTSVSDGPSPATPGVRLGVDVGSVRVGVAISDPHGILAIPVGTFPRNPPQGTVMDRIAALVAEHDVVEVVVGLPRSLSGREGPAVVAARDFARRLERSVTVPIRFVDERFTSVTANRILAERGVRGRKARSVVDQVAAVEILQHHLDLTRSRGGLG